MKLIIFILLAIVIYILIGWAKKDYINPLIIYKQSKVAKAITKTINNLYEKKIISVNKKYLTALKISLVSLILFLISVILIYIYIKVLSTAIILSIPILISPLILSKILIFKNKQRISKQLPFYVVNIKNQMKDENNIIQAIKRAKVEAPLSKYINEFTATVFNGGNVFSAFEKLKKDVNVKDFTELINSFEVCYKNGGDFLKILEKYILMKTKERLYKQEMEEKSFASIVTLLAMNIMNIVVIITFVLANNEYASFIRGSVIGRVILNFNVITYMLSLVTIFRIYKEE